MAKPRKRAKPTAPGSLQRLSTARVQKLAESMVRTRAVFEAALRKTDPNDVEEIRLLQRFVQASVRLEGLARENLESRKKK